VIKKGQVMPGSSMIFVPFKTNPKPKNNSKKSTPSQVVRFVILKKKLENSNPKFQKHLEYSKKIRNIPKHSEKNKTNPENPTNQKTTKQIESNNNV
jgi:hypothetical protein